MNHDVIWKSTKLKVNSILYNTNPWSYNFIILEEVDKKSVNEGGDMARTVIAKEKEEGKLVMD